MNYELAEVKEFTKRYSGTRFTLKWGVFVDEEVTVVGYADRDVTGVPCVIVELPETSLLRCWGLNELGPRDHVIADVAEDARLWYARIENLEAC